MSRPRLSLTHAEAFALFLAAGNGADWFDDDQDTHHHDPDCGPMTGSYGRYHAYCPSCGLCNGSRTCDPVLIRHAIERVPCEDCGGALALFDAEAA